MKCTLTLLLALFTYPLFAQQDHSRIYDLVMEQHVQLRHAQHYNLFAVDRSSARTNEFDDVVENATLLNLDVVALKQIRRADAGYLTMSVPRADGRDFDLTLIPSNVFADDFQLFAASSPDRPLDLDLGDHYMGILDGDPRSVVAMSIFDNDVVGMIMTDEGNYVLGHVEDTRGQYILYNDKDLIPEFPASCETPDDDYSYTLEEISDNSSARGVGDCVRIYVEVHEDITNQKGSVSQAANYVAAVFNQSAILYTNDNMTITISEMKVWDTPSPYTSTSTQTLLSQFQSNVGAFNGDLGHLVGYDGSGGIAAGFSGICNPNPDNSMCYSGIQATFANVPTYSWTVMVVTHEMGHLFGCRHTHACVWNGNNTAIDGCAGFTEGSCSLPGNPPDGGTIMSYCHTQSVGINLNLGFGPQPGNVARNSVANGACLTQCGNNTCAVPNGLSTSGVDNVSATLSWNAVSNANSYDVEYRESGAASWTAASATTTSYALTGLTLGTDYEWRVRTQCAGGTVSNYSTVATFTTTGAPPAAYCASQGSNVQFEWIEAIEVANLSNTSGADGGYADYTSLVASMQAGQTYTATLTAGYGGSSYVEQWSIWIDYNGDLDFEDAGEQVATTSGSGAVTATFTVPTDASGSTRMRVSMKWGSAPAPCETFSYGEVEDYTVTFDAAACNVPSGLSSSNVTQTEATLAWGAVTNAVNYKVQLRPTGSSTWTVEGDINGTAASATGLTPNTSYDWRVRTNCSASNSNYSPVETFTTLDNSGGCTVQDIIYDDFESGWGNWNDGGSDCRRSNQDAQYAIGTYCVRLRDNTSSSVMTTDNLDLSSYSELTVAFTYIARSMDNANEDFWLQISTDGGVSYTTVEEWNLNDEFENGTRYNDTVAITGTFTSNSRLRFRCDASGNSDWVYIDNVDVDGCAATTLLTPSLSEVMPDVPVTAINNSSSDDTEELESELFDTELSVYPNPTDDRLSVEFAVDRAQVIELYLVSIDGKSVRQLKRPVEAGYVDYDMQVGELHAGIYTLVVKTESDVMTKMVMIR